MLKYRRLSCPCGASIPSESMFEYWLLHFLYSSLLTHPWKQQEMVPVFGPTPPTWDTQMEFKLPGCSLASHSCCGPLQGGGNQQMEVTLSSFLRSPVYVCPPLWNYDYFTDKSSKITKRDGSLKTSKPPCITMKWCNVYVCARAQMKKKNLGPNLHIHSSGKKKNARTLPKASELQLLFLCMYYSPFPEPEWRGMGRKNSYLLCQATQIIQSLILQVRCVYDIACH